MFGADTGVAGQFIEGPVVAHVVGHPFPQALETVVELPWLREVLHVAVNQFDPVKHRGRLGFAFVLGDQSLNGVPERRPIKRRHDGGTTGENSPLLGLLFVAHPAAFPVLTGYRAEGVGHEGRERNGSARTAFFPAPIHEDAAFAFQTGEKVGAALMNAHHFVGCPGDHHPGVADAVGSEGVANWCASNPRTAVRLVRSHDPILGVFTDDVGFG